jgi:DnaK suppressor protein
MTREEGKQVRDRILTELDLLKRRISDLEVLANLLSSEDTTRKVGLRELIRAQSENEKGLRGARARLNKLESALQKIDDPDFGACFICEEPIAAAMIIRMPEITRCARCKDISP